MVTAPLGDEQRRDDPSVNRLEAEVAELLGKEAAVLVPSATLANQIAVALLAPPGSEVLCHENSHVYNFEGGGIAANSGAQVRPLAGPNGIFDGDAVVASLRQPDPHFARARLVVIENTNNQGGGSIWPEESFASVVKSCSAHSLYLHLDGARLFNAAVKRGVAVEHWGRHVDTVQLCFSKGLGCPFGAILAGSKPLIAEARFVKQRMGGALRQAGIIAGAMLHALHHHIERLSHDHDRLQRLAELLSESGHFELWSHETNILYFRPKTGDCSQFARSAQQSGVQLSHLGGRLRACTHLGITDQNITEAAAILCRLAT
ncbi:MAG: L-allo-threonine aldolase [Pseudomonadota bacterium]